jgi:DNA-binding SARP family transcriptional activator
MRVTPRRDTLQRAWEELQLQLAQIKTEQVAYANALEILDRLRTSDPTNETALQRLMILLTHLDRRGEALQVYQHYVKTLQRDEAIKVRSPQSEETAATILYHLSKGGNEPTNSISHPEQTAMGGNDRPD